MGSRGLARLHAVAAAAVLSTALIHAGDAHALALGRIVVQSALGEPLRAEIDVPDINADEAASLRVGLASGEAFRAAGMDFNPALTSLQITLQRRPDGRAFLRLTSPRAVTEPFVDLIVEANWASGRIVRDYTLLFDPPNLRAGTPSTPLPPVVAPSAPTQVLPPVARPVAPAQPAPGAMPAPPMPSASSRPLAPPRDTASNGQVRVRPGDTAGRIADANRTANVSLDQMLVAMLRGNPGAFIGGNVNRIKAGSVLDLPSEAEAVAVNPGEARQVIAAQSRDFNEFRRRLAGSVPAAAVGAADRQATGRVQAEVEDRRPAAPSQDKLTLSKGATPAASATEEKIAQERQAQEASTRVAELSRNIEELARLGAAPAAPATAAPAAPVSPNPGAPGIAVPTLPASATPATAEPSVEAAAPVTSTPTATAADATETTAETPTPTAVLTPAAPAPSVPAPVEEPSLIDGLRDNPFVLPGVAALLALLGGLGIYRLRQRKKANGVDSSFLESRLQPDSFFGSSGGQRIDTAEAGASGSSMVYSPSQLDAAGDVDPVAEADVYLAYGRDLQAEEILKEAMRSTPTRVAIHNKLLEIYAKRRDAKAFEVVATEAFGLTQGQGPEWEHACDLGRELDPANALYQPGGAPPVKAGAVAAVAGGAMNTMPFGNSTLGQPAGTGGLNEGLDLDLDFSLDEPSAAMPLEDTPVASATREAPLSALDDLDRTEALTQEAAAPEGPSSMSMDFDLDFPSEPAALAGEPSRLDSAAETPTFDPDEELPDFELSDEQPDALLDDDEPMPLPSSQDSPQPELLSFDLNDLNLDLDTDAGTSDAADGGLTEENPLDTKLSLAEEFRAIGDLEGARSLAEEVLAEATGTLKTKASTFLADLS
ncbi:MAG: FimV/HubP family polar landmark protein [Hydrogenophaga sp.]|nr:FimV/HubP family polar landmark protein [Hydrogenophaga sp.]